MTKLDKIFTEIKNAMKEGNTLKRDVLRMLKTELDNERIKLRHDLTETEESLIILRESKKLKEELESRTTESGIAESKQKIAIIEPFLPELVSDEEIISYLKEQGVQKGDHAGKTMGLLMKKYKGKIDSQHAMKVINKEFGN